MDRPAELGVGRMFGVPGDHSLAMPDHVVRHPVVEWTGCTNELNAGYAVAEIDRVLVEVRDRRLPGYLLLAADVAEAPVERSTTPLPRPVDGTDPEALAEFTEAARRVLGAEAASVGSATFGPVTLPAALEALAPLAAAVPGAAAPELPAVDTAALRGRRHPARPGHAVGLDRLPRAWRRSRRPSPSRPTSVLFPGRAATLLSVSARGTRVRELP